MARGMQSRVATLTRRWPGLTAAVERSERRCQRALTYASATLPDGPVGSLCMLADRMPLTPEQVLLCYSQGLFLMDYSGRLRWESPDPRSVLLLDNLRVSGRTRRAMERAAFDIRFDTDIEGVLRGCADRTGTWMSPRILDVYRALADLGALHTVEAWRGGELVGGSFGIAIGRVFMGESSFGRVSDAGKFAFIRKAEHLRELGFDAIDCQEHKPHFARFGATELPRDEFRRLLARGLAAPVPFTVPPATAPRAVNT